MPYSMYACILLVLRTKQPSTVTEHCIASCFKKFGSFWRDLICFTEYIPKIVDAILDNFPDFADRKEIERRYSHQNNKVLDDVISFE